MDLRIWPWDIAMQCIVTGWLWLHRDCTWSDVRCWRRRLEPARGETEHSSETLSHNQTFDRPSHMLTSSAPTGAEEMQIFVRVIIERLSRSRHNLHLLGLDSDYLRARAYTWRKSCPVTDKKQKVENLLTYTAIHLHCMYVANCIVLNC